MKESISYTFLLNIIITFIVISFFVIMCIMSYTKAFRVNSKIVNTIEISEGYNKVAKPEINRILTSYGYQKINVKCQPKEGQYAIGYDGQRLPNDRTTDGTCIYKFENGDKYNYGVVTYMTFDFPIVNTLIRIPVYTRTMSLYELG